MMNLSAGPRAPIADRCTRCGRDPLAVDTPAGRITLSRPSKMPGYAFGTTAGDTCPAAKKTLRDYGKSAVCASCYACRGNYTFPNVRAAYQRRGAFLQYSIREDSGESAIKVLSYLIGRATVDAEPIFRVSDSGDLFRPEVANVWSRVADNLPGVSFWIPTREYLRPIMLPHLRKLNARRNVVVRPSAAVIGQGAPDVPGLSAGTAVIGGDVPAGHYACPATQPGNPSSCDGNACRACWNSTARIAYTFHGGNAPARNVAAIARARSYVRTLGQARNVEAIARARSYVRTLPVA